MFSPFELYVTSFATKLPVQESRGKGWHSSFIVTAGRHLAEH